MKPPDNPGPDDRPSDAKPLISALLHSVDSVEGRQRVARHLQSLPFPHYEPAETPGQVVRIEADGSRKEGRFYRREFRVNGRFPPDSG
jgi:hypothetical protein